MDWNHPMCDTCWNKKNAGAKPARIPAREIEVCCFCGRNTESGIYVRYNPQLLACKGEHEAKVE